MKKIILALSLFACSFSAHSVPKNDVSPISIGESFTIESKILGESRRVNVYTPANYSDGNADRFPVLYMLDGGVAEDFLHIAGLMQVSIANGTMRPFILVGIENTERRRDLTTPTNNEDDKKVAPHVGGSALFRDFIKRELIAEVNSRYRTTSERAIVGESFAGLFVVETLLIDPNLFDTYIALDPSLWWNDKALLTEANSLQEKNGAQNKSAYFANSKDFGEKASKQISEVFCQNVSEPVIRVCEYMPDETHATIYHPAAIRAFRVLFKPKSAGDSGGSP